MNTLLGKILYPLDMADTGVDVYYTYPPTRGEKIPAKNKLA